MSRKSRLFARAVQQRYQLRVMNNTGGLTRREQGLVTREQAKSMLSPLWTDIKQTRRLRPWTKEKGA